MTFLACRQLARVVMAGAGGGAAPFKEWLGRSSAGLMERLGGAFPKTGQILSTRADLIPEDIRASLCQLQDQVTPLDVSRTQRLLAKCSVPGAFRMLNETPVASATVAQVHRALRRDSEQCVALKLLCQACAASSSRIVASSGSSGGSSPGCRRCRAFRSTKPFLRPARC